MILGIIWQFIHRIVEHIQPFHFSANDLHCGCAGLWCLSIWFGKKKSFSKRAEEFYLQKLSHFLPFQLIKNINFGMLFILMLDFINVMNLFLYCYFGKMATHSFEKMASCLYRANWHYFPIELQKYYVIMIGNAQRPLYYHGFGVAILNLETFTKVSNFCCNNFFGIIQDLIIIFSFCVQFTHAIWFSRL